jgi:DNA-binding CsgD family transcriptional regulator
MNHLTPRECAVIDALLAGHTTTPELKAALDIGDKMVEIYFTRIYRKTGTRTRAALILWALHNGWILPSKKGTDPP